MLARSAGGEIDDTEVPISSWSVVPSMGGQPLRSMEGLLAADCVIGHLLQNHLAMNSSIWIV